MAIDKVQNMSQLTRPRCRAGCNVKENIFDEEIIPCVKARSGPWPRSWFPPGSKAQDYGVDPPQKSWCDTCMPADGTNRRRLQGITILGCFSIRPPPFTTSNMSIGIVLPRYASRVHLDISRHPRLTIYKARYAFSLSLSFGLPFGRQSG